MRVGVPKEVRELEYRVALTPAGARELVLSGHEVLVERGAGAGSGLDDAAYAEAGARLVDDAATAWGESDVVCKVKEPEPAEHRHLREGMVLFSYLHLAAAEALTAALVAAGTTAIAYETVRDRAGGLPLLWPMSTIAGRMAPQVGAHELERWRQGRGVLLGGMPGVPPARVVVIGAGTAGSNAARIAAGMEASVTVLDLDVAKLAALELPGRVTTLASSRSVLEEQLATADLVVGAVLVPGARAPRVLTEEMVAAMPPGSVLVDLSIDQGGCAVTSRPTTHRDPTYVKHGVVHYCVGNVPGAVPRTSTYGLTNATLPYLRLLAEHGVARAARADAGLAEGINVAAGAVTNRRVADAHGRPFTALDEVLEER